MTPSRFALLGHPVSHSLSPRIHAAFARQTGIDMRYTAIDAEDFDAALAAFDGDGANVTLPHKQRAAAACSTLGERARRAGVVNTPWRCLRVNGPVDLALTGTLLLIVIILGVISLLKYLALF